MRSVTPIHWLCPGMVGPAWQSTTVPSGALLPCGLALIRPPAPSAARDAFGVTNRHDWPAWPTGVQQARVKEGWLFIDTFGEGPTLC